MNARGVTQLIDWGPATLVLFVLVMNTACVFALFNAPLKWMRLLLAECGLLLVMYAAVFVCSGFGWGWSSNAVGTVTAARFGLGLGVGLSTILVASVISRRWRTGVAAAVLAIQGGIFTPDPDRFLAWQLLLSAVTMASAHYIWYRSPRNQPRSKD
jgi:hypothetical protein